MKYSNIIKKGIKTSVVLGLMNSTYLLTQFSLKSILNQEFKFSQTEVHSKEGCVNALRQKLGSENIFGQNIGKEINAIYGISGNAWNVFPNAIYTFRDYNMGFFDEIKNFANDVLRSGNQAIFNIYFQQNIDSKILQEKINLYNKINIDWTKLVEEGNKSNIEENEAISNKYGEEINNLYSKINVNNLNNIKKILN